MPTKILSKEKSPSQLEIDLQYASPAIAKRVSAIASASLIKKWVKATIGRHGSITLRFVNPAEAKKLNSSYRNKDKATNVLTFPYELTRKALAADIIFCLPVIQKEALEQGKAVKAHLAH
jgi:probable rRNA maturation factor